MSAELAAGITTRFIEGDQYLTLDTHESACVWQFKTPGTNRWQYGHYLVEAKRVE